MKGGVPVNVNPTQDEPHRIKGPYGPEMVQGKSEGVSVQILYCLMVGYRYKNPTAKPGYKALHPFRPEMIMWINY